MQTQNKNSTRGYVQINEIRVRYFLSTSHAPNRPGERSNEPFLGEMATKQDIESNGKNNNGEWLVQDMVCCLSRRA